jgi:ABC-2 type transport system ATP-binding protein
MTVRIAIDQLSKIYGSENTPALDKLSLQVQQGEIYGFLGANGAGKSTTIRLLLNFIQPSGGTAYIEGLDIKKDSVAVKRSVGYLAGDVALYQKPTGRKLLDFLSSIQPATNYRSVLEKRFQADLDKPINTLSKGNRQKIGIIQAFMHEPSVLILDEPTSGLDPLMQEAFYQTLVETKQRGASVLMSSHNLAEAQEICDRVGVIKHGKLIREQTIAEDTTLGTLTFKVTFSNPSDLVKSRSAIGIHFVSKVDNQTALYRSTSTIQAALATLSHYKIQSISTETVDLEAEFLEYYGDKP